MKNINDFEQGNICKLVLKLAIPSMIAQLVTVLYSIIDRMYIGNIPDIGSVALAGVGICGPIITLITSFGTLIGIGGSILMSIKLGENDTQQAKNVLSNSFLLLICFSAILTILFLLFKEKLLIWFGASNFTFAYANTYLTIYTIGTFFALLAVGMNYFITCQGFSGIAMTTIIIGAVSNIILDTIFIFIFNMGVSGAALATVISQLFSCIFAIGFLFSKKPFIKITFGNYSIKIIKKIILIGISPFLILSTDSVIIIIMNAVLQKYGGVQQGDILISSATIVQSYMMLITGPLIGITSGTQSIISYNYGARKIDRIKSAKNCILIMAVLFTTTMFFISRIIPEYFVKIFTSSPENIELAIWGIKIFTLSIIPLSFQYSLVDCLTALGCVKISLCLSMSRKLLYVIFMVTLPIFLQAKNIFYADPLADLIGGIVSTIVFLLLFNKVIRKTTI